MKHVLTTFAPASMATSGFRRLSSICEQNIYRESHSDRTSEARKMSQSSRKGGMTTHVQ
jgi:hypothetical protein